MVLTSLPSYRVFSLGRKAGGEEGKKEGMRKVKKKEGG